MAPPSLKHFKVLAFDIYGTLIDEDDAIFADLAPIYAKMPSDLRPERGAIERVFYGHESRLMTSEPTKLYRDIMAESYVATAMSFGVAVPDEEAEAFGLKGGSRPAWPDTVEAMKVLGKHYKLIALSNVDHANFTPLLAGPLKGVHFDATYIAEDIGSYKPNLKNFEYLLSHVKSDFGVEKDNFLMVAHGVLSDHGPAKKLRLWSAWIEREGPGEEAERDWEHTKANTSWQWQYKTLGDFAEAVTKAFEE